MILIGEGQWFLTKKGGGYDGVRDTQQCVDIVRKFPNKAGGWQQLLKE